MDTFESILNKLRILVVGLLVVTVLFLLSILVTTVQTPAQSVTATAKTRNLPSGGGTNAVSVGLNAMLVELYVMTEGANKSLTGSAKSTGSVVGRVAKGASTLAASGGRMVATGMHFGVTYTASNMKTSLTMLARGVGSSLAFMFYTTSSLMGLMSNSPMVAAVGRPASSGKVPTIIPGSASQFAAVSAMPALQAGSQTSAQTIPAASVWPISGQITTFFGVPHWPYQPTHTGMDISSGKPSGVTQVRPFKAGRVIDVVFSKYSLGNNIVVDHGDGVTSVYAHLYSIGVKPGQDVTTDTVLGTEGSTGVSTGPHLHLEIRVNGQPMNPQNYITGQP